MEVKYIDLAAQYNSMKAILKPTIEKILESGQYILGENGKEFEAKMAAYNYSHYALGVANGTDALMLSLKALGIGRDDEVITAPNSFFATAGAINAVGARPVFIDVADDYNIDVSKIEKAINPATKAIMPIHLTGRPANMPAIMDIAKKHNLYVVEDAAQAIGAQIDGKKVGNYGDLGCFSLHPLKTLNAFGDAGFITTSNGSLYEKIKKMRNHGLKNRDEVEYFGYNSRLDEIQAALLNKKVIHLDSWNKGRREVADQYRKGLEGVVELPLPEKDNEFHVYHTFIIQSDKRNDLQAYLKAEGIETKIHYPIPIHLQEATKYLGYKKGDFPVAERQAGRILSLPIYQGITSEKVDYVIDKIKAYKE